MPSKVATPNPFPKFKPPESLSIEEQLVMCVGKLVAEWAVCETLFRGMYVCLIGGHSEIGSDYAEIAWLSTPNVKSRRDLLARCIVASGLPSEFKDEVALLSKRFKTISETRNFYCHAFYVVEPVGLQLQSIEGYNLTYDDEIISVETKKASKSTVGEILTAIHNCENLSRECMGFLFALHAKLQARFPVLPSVPDGYLNNPRFPLQ